jgi:DHA3 family macrolide efflux protein-like MFS transporter
MEELANQANQKTFRSYLMFWSGQLFSLFGSMVVYFVIIWWITVETQSLMYLAIASFLYIICQVIVLPIAGVLADRLNRKVIILVVDSLQAVATLILLVLFQLNLANIWIVFIFISIRSVFQAFHLPTVNSIIPTMVPKESLLFTGVVQILAPLIGATLMIFLPINTILWVDIITFCIAVIPLILIKIPSVRNPKEVVEKNSFIKEFKLGIKTIKAIPGLITVIFYSMFITLTLFMVVLRCI